MANALILRRAHLPISEKSKRAAQYVRISTSRQKYSIENQAAAIAAYAARYNLNIVRTYKDEGLSGLKINQREGLKQLITDICSRRADFSRVLGRWKFAGIAEAKTPPA